MVYCAVVITNNHRMIYCAEITANKQSRHQSYTALNLLLTNRVSIDGILRCSYC